VNPTLATVLTTPSTGAFTPGPGRGFFSSLGPAPAKQRKECHASYHGIR
jgi:hypothetical protein